MELLLLEIKLEQDLARVAVELMWTCQVVGKVWICQRAMQV
ncbi:hypothetical protein HMPREF0742_00009 [Rothia aeria F0184]|uniref:Uncharacterized protein n=1 Tax=Rothia aeria F0184 TaxID=888019 RepID=U7V7Y8_9MICC|nr:hypothetical protein HMPREF0742_00009 [Rothia aeria F0184]